MNKRSPLTKRIPRDFIKNIGKYLGMIIILVCTISVGSSFQISLDGAIDYLDRIKTENIQEDGFFETLMPISEASERYFKDRNIEVAENFYVTDSEFSGDCTVFVFNERNELDLPVVFTGRLPEKTGEIALDHVFAAHKELKIGDTMELLGKKLTVVGTVSLPDYSSLFLNNTDLVMNTSHFCVSVVTEETFRDFGEGNITYRYSYRTEDRDMSQSEKISLSEDILKKLVQNGEALQTLLRSDQNQSISFLEMDIGTDGPFMKVFVYILIVMIAFVFSILINNTIDNESVIIGTLLASGYTKGEIIWHYLQPTLIVAIISSIIGNALGYTVMLEPFMNVYYSTYSIGPIYINFSVPAFITTTVLPVVLMFGINYLMLRRKLSLSPLKFLRHDLKRGKQKHARKLPDISFLNRFRLRVILQNKGSYIMLFTGVFLASFLLMFGIGLGPLMNHYTDSIDESLPFEYQYILKAPVEADGGEKIRIYEMDTWFALGKKDLGVTLMGIDEDNRFFESVSTHETAISSALSQKLNLRAGDELTLKDTAKEKEYKIKIDKVIDYEASMALFMNRAELNKLLGDEEELFNCLLSDKKLDIDDLFVAKKLSRSDFLGAATQMLDSFGTIIFFVNVFSVVVYMILIYILTKVVVDKNALSISFMKVFGYEHSEIRKVYLTATSIVVIISLIICIPVEVLMFKGVLVFLSSMVEGYIGFYLPYYIYLEIILIGLAAYFSINALHLRSINKIPMTDALKNRE